MELISSVVTVAVIVIIIIILTSNNEGFTSRERIIKINKWFQDNPNPKYINFRKELNGDIVEYETGLIHFVESV